MRKSRRFATLAAMLCMAFALLSLAGCGAQVEKQLEERLGQSSVAEQPAEGGVLILRVNPEIAISYDAQGVVTSVEGRNDEGRALVTSDDAYVGLSCRDVVSKLVSQIKDAGYIVEEVEGEGNNIVIEVEHGSTLPSDNFLNGIVADTQTYLGQHRIPATIEVHGESAYGWEMYSDSDYGPDNDGATDYHVSDYGTAVDDTDYGPNNDGVTDYNDNSNYGSAGATANTGSTNTVGNTNYDSNSNYADSNTNYNSNYGNTSSTPAPAPKPEPAPAPKPDPAPSGGNSNYGNSSYGGNSGYDDSGNSGYDDGGNSGYGGSSGYDGES